MAEPITTTPSAEGQNDAEKPQDGPEVEQPKPLLGQAEEQMADEIQVVTTQPNGNPDKTLRDAAEKEESATMPAGWQNVDTSHGEEEFTISAEQKAEMDRIAARKGAAIVVVDTLIPSKTIEELVETVKASTPQAQQKTRQTQTPVVDDGDWVGMEDAKPLPSMPVPPSREDMETQIKAGVLQKQEQLFKQEFAEQLAKTHIPEADLPEYASLVYAAAREITAPNRDLSIYTLRTFVDTSESIGQAQLYAQLAQQWKERFLITAPDDRVWQNRANNFSQFIHEASGVYTSPKPEPRSAQETTALFEALSEVYNTAYAIPENEESQRIFNTLTNGARDLGLRTHDPDQIRQVLQIYQEVANEPNRELMEKIMDTVITYGRRHSLTEDATQGFVQKLVPAMRSNDAQVAILTRGGNIWGMESGDFGAADFLVHAYALRVTPAHVNELLMAAREVPTTDLARLEQNRVDALTLAGPFGALRDFIHDQRPYVHEVIEAMVKYYDTGDSQQLLAILDKTDPGYLGSKDRRAAILYRSIYDTLIEARQTEGNPWKETVKPIDILRRLNENTKPIEDTPPVTSDETFNSLLRGLAKNGSQAALQQTLDYANNRLIAIMQRGEIGIEPNLILAFAFLDRKGFQTLQKLNYEDQMRAYRQGWFYSILRFQELTASSSDYNEAEFQQFLNQVASTESSQAAYRLIGRRELENASKLARTYRGMGKKNMVGALWSGNIKHELIGLTDLRPAATEQGRKAAREATLRVHEPGYHPGD